MRKPLFLISTIALLGTPAFAQVRPENCQPVLPVVDRVASVLPQDVVTQPASPVAAVAKKRFLGLPLLLPALLGAGGIGALAASSHSNDNTPTVSPG
jgi:hypothetical protein